MTAVRPTRRRQWIIPAVVLLGLAFILFGALYTIDNLVGGNRSVGYFNFTHDHITDAVGGMSGLFAAVLGIIITVVSIIVQLSAERYTHVTQMFFRDKTNLVVLGFYVLSCICGVLNSFSLHTEWVPRVTLTTMIVMASISFAVMAPYFAYVFDFLQPENIVARIRRDALRATAAGAHADDERTRAEAQAKTLHSMEELTDITINSISGKDKIIATAGVDALKDFAVKYLSDKAKSSPAWFTVGPGIRKNPDFVSMAPESIDDMEKKHTWVEWKILRQYQAIYAEAIQQMRDVAYVIAIDTRYIGETATWADDKDALAACVKFMNTFLRVALNARDVRTAYNLLHQYRAMTEGLLRAGWHDKAVEIAGYFKYYAHTSYAMQLGFVTEVCSYDLGALCELAHTVRSPAEKDLLEVFLQVDQPQADQTTEEMGLRGVRKAQAKLATFYLCKGAEPLARRIFEDMKRERPERLKSIRDELMRVESEDFWEVIDRGTNFDYLPPERKQALQTFFGWFPRLSGDMMVPAPPKEASS